MKALERSINARLDNVDDGVQDIREIVSIHAERLAVLESAKRTEQKKTFSLAGVVTLAGIAIAEGVKRFFGL